jgi:MerR family transcriptional regulator, copper efflux regulator
VLLAVPYRKPSTRVEGQLPSAAATLRGVRIGELAAQIGVAVRTIRFYEQTGVLPAPARTPAGYRAYTDDAVTRLRFVRTAQTLGLSLAEIADVLRIRDTQGPPCAYVTELLHAHLGALQARLAELTALRDELRDRLPSAAGPDPTRFHPEQVCYLLGDTKPAE